MAEKYHSQSRDPVMEVFFHFPGHLLVSHGFAMLAKGRIRTDTDRIRKPTFAALQETHILEGRRKLHLPGYRIQMHTTVPPY